MRPAQIAGVTILLTAVCAAPAVADPVPLTDALQAVGDACAASRVSLLTTGGRVTDTTSTLASAPDRFAVTGVQSNRVVVAGDGTYGSLADDRLRGKDRRAALRYIKSAGATWWVNRDAYWSPALGWGATFEQSAQAAVPLDATCSQQLAGAADPVQRDAGTWTFAIPGSGDVVVTLDGQGRVTRLGTLAVAFGAQSVSVPAGAVEYAAWQKASQAASLNSTMKRISRSVAAAVNTEGPTVAAIDAATRAAVPTDRVVPLKVRQLRRGVLIHARNPYTKTYHAWRVYLKNGDAVARRVAP